MNVFENAKASTTPRQVAERYGLKVSRGGMVRCPFHDDHTPSMKLNDNYFYCFGCHESGDVIDLTAKLLGIRKYEAAQQLAGCYTAMQAKPPPQSQLAAELRQLRDWKVRYAPKTPEDKLDERFIIACHRLEYVAYLYEVEREESCFERHNTPAV